MDTYVRTLTEAVVEGKRLGRHVEHDPRSRDFGWKMTDTPLRSVAHSRHGSIFNQGQIGSCTGNASAGACNTEPFYSTDKHPLFHEADALSIYEAATLIDNVEGSYPPDDTGSSGLAVAKVLKTRGLVKSYSHAFGITQALDALMNQAIIAGVSWYEGFDNPDANGVVVITGQVRGGHEIMAREYRMVGSVPSTADLVVFDNSWGTTFGKSGRFAMTVFTFGHLLEQDGDVTILQA